LIDQVSSGLIATINCNYPCQTCSATNKSFCLSCFSAPSTLIYLQNNTCAATCSDGFSGNGGTTCVACNSACLTCQMANKNLCATCNFSSSTPFYYATNQFCYASCPSTSYNQTATFTCIDCTSPCASCTGPAITQCTSCLGSTLTPYLSGTTCVSTCPVSTVPINMIC